MQGGGGVRAKHIKNCGCKGCHPPAYCTQRASGRAAVANLISSDSRRSGTAKGFAKARGRLGALPRPSQARQRA